jgi:enamine deaminase RidA (YjgF/YER057c/UK114 family)
VRAPGGRLWHGPSFKVLHLASVHGRAGDSREAQARQMFATAARAAAASNLSYASTVRTWIYVRRLLEWYGVLNRVRTEIYRTYDFTLPASTGIQGTGGPEECLMDALLADGVPTTTIDRSSRQGPAFAYGSSFSRARALDYEGGRTVYVSGTASIDPGGKSIHQGDPAAQLLETLLDVGAVLAEAGMTLADIVQATLFCKDARTWAACRQVPALLGIPRLPTVCVIADVCREELLVEMEAVASR